MDEIEVEPSEVSDKPILHLQPLQLAIVAQQGVVLETILQHMVNCCETEDSIDLLKKQLGHKAKIDFPKSATKQIYDKDDRSLDGMNAFHLAAKYYPESLEIMFKVLNDAKYYSILELLLEKDHHLEQTPLHVALRNRSSKSLDAVR